MIKTYFDEYCKNLKLPHNLKLPDNYSALWFCIEKGDDSSCFLKFLVSNLNPFSGFFWLASSNCTGSTKLLELKRSFGNWRVKKGDIVSKNDFVNESGVKTYSDIVKIKDGNINELSLILNRNLFGIDSAIFFLPAGKVLSSNDIVKPLEELLVKRSSMKEIEESLLNQGLIEKFFAGVISIGGVTTVTLRDSNMNTMVVAVGNHSIS